MTKNKEYIFSTADMYAVDMRRFDELNELIRCKDCKYLRFTGTVWKCQNRIVMMLCEPNDYCSRAEREEHAID